jgi:hypothetical protein
MVTICIPPLVQEEAQRVAAEHPLVHPAWEKVKRRGRHLTLQTSDFCDIEELADWAKSWLEEPSQPLDKATRQAFQNVIARAGRHVHLKPIGTCHFLVTGWKQRDKQR